MSDPFSISTPDVHHYRDLTSTLARLNDPDCLSEDPAFASLTDEQKQAHAQQRSLEAASASMTLVSLLDRFLTIGSKAADEQLLHHQLRDQAQMEMCASHKASLLPLLASLPPPPTLRQPSSSPITLSFDVSRFRATSFSRKLFGLDGPRVSSSSSSSAASSSSLLPSKRKHQLLDSQDVDMTTSSSPSASASSSSKFSFVNQPRSLPVASSPFPSHQQHHQHPQQQQPSYIAPPSSSSFSRQNAPSYPPTSSSSPPPQSSFSSSSSSSSSATTSARFKNPKLGSRTTSNPNINNGSYSYNANSNSSNSYNASSHSNYQQQQQHQRTQSNRRFGSGYGQEEDDDEGGCRNGSSRALSRGNPEEASLGFMSGTDKLAIDHAKQYGAPPPQQRAVGLRRKFIPPKTNQNQSSSSSSSVYGQPSGGIQNANVPSFVKKAFESNKEKDEDSKEDVPEILKNCDPKLVEMISNEIMSSPGVKWEDIAGLEFAKSSVMEIVVWPLRRPDLFKGLRGPPKGILLFGPPGTGKTMIGKAIASEAGAKFFSISASSLTSKWSGESEKLVRTLFALATLHQPSVIFIDEIDSLLSQRNEGEVESNRRLKTEFLIRLDGAATSGDERILVVGATNRPQELDEAARRRLVKRLYIPLPDSKGREQLLRHLLRSENHSLSDEDIQRVCERTEGYSGADIRALCTEAAFGPIRSVVDISNVDQNSVRPINYRDFESGLQQVRASVSQKDLQQYVAWNEQYGSFAIAPSN